MSSPTDPSPRHDEPLPAATIAIGVTLGLFAIIVAIAVTTAIVFLVYKCWCRRMQYTALPGSSGIDQGIPSLAEHILTLLVLHSSWMHLLVYIKFHGFSTACS